MVDTAQDLLNRMDSYKHRSSWAVWADDDITFPSNPTGLHSNAIVIAGNPGNAAAATNRRPWQNFHTGRRHNDHFLATAFRDTPVEGGYMTDLYEQIDSVMANVNTEKDILDLSVKHLAKEFKTLRAVDPIVVLVGTHAVKLLDSQHLDEFAEAVGTTADNLRWAHVPHYSRQNCKTHDGDPERYRAAVGHALANTRKKFTRDEVVAWLVAQGF